MRNLLAALKDMDVGTEEEQQGPAGSYVMAPQAPEPAAKLWRRLQIKKRKRSKISGEFPE
jgi:hypothetical protein